MPLIETDLLYAAMDKSDHHHKVAKQIFSLIKDREIRETALSSLSLHELELNLKAGNILIRSKVATPKDTILFFKKINDLLKVYSIKLLPLTCNQIIKATELRKKHKELTFYDSHHAAAAILHDKKIISTDKVYDKIKGLQRIDPYNYTKSTTPPG